MSKLLHRVAIPEVDIASDGVQVYDLPTNPLSVILLTIRPLNNNTRPAYATYFDVCSALNQIRVVHQGAAVISMSGADLAALNYHRHGMIPMEANDASANNDRRAVVLPIILGRFAYDSSSCLPSSRRGELTLEIDFDIAGTNYDDVRFSAETIELVGASPKSWERKITTTQTFSATGDNDVQLPSSSKLRGLLLFGTTAFTGGSPAPTLGRLSLFKDGEQVCYASTDFETLMATSQLMGRQGPLFDHMHYVNAGGGSQEATGPAVQDDGSGLRNYCWMDLDPTRDDSFALDTKGATSLFVRSDAEAANAMRIVTVERMS